MLKQCFNSLDEDGGGSIGIDEMKDSLIGLGFVDTIEEVQTLIDLVDEDGSGCIEFGEFLSIIKNNNAGEQTKAIKHFFTNLTKGDYGAMEIAFPNYVLEKRRRSLIDAIKETDEKKRNEGRRILKNYTTQRKQEKGIKPK